MDYKELTRKLNEFREKALRENRTFTSVQLYEEFEKMGFNASIAKRVAALMEYEKIGTSKLYSMPEKPIHKDRIEGLYKDAQKSHKKYAAKHSREKFEDMTEKQALDMLIKKGYRIKKAIKFDLERFMVEQPEMYRRYCIYEYV
jgi:hypothetical protein